MLRNIMTILLLVSLCTAACAATTVTLNGKTVSVPTIESKGKAYVDVIALMKLLGGSASFNPSTHKVSISTSKPSGGSGGGSAGTVQLAGDNGELGRIYSLGKNYPLYFSLKSAEFTVDQVPIGDMTYYPKANEKLLLLHFTVQNPTKSDRFVRWDSLTMMAVDAMDMNHDCRAYWGMETSKQGVGLSLKPAQTIACYTVIPVPAKGPIPKLMVQIAGETAPVLRYDLRDKVKALSAPVADTSDPSGVTALEIVPVALNTVCSLERLDITVEKFDYADKVGEKTADGGGKFLLATVLIKNISGTDRFVRWDTIVPLLTSVDGGNLRYNEMLLASSDRGFGQAMKPGSEVRLRLAFTVPKDVTPKTLAIREGQSRTYECEVK